MRVGVIGLGAMGAGMAQSLLAAGHEVTVWNRTPERARTLQEAGARLAEAPAQALEGDAAVTMLSTDEAVDEVVLKSGALNHAGPGLVHVMSATISPQFSQQLAKAHADHGVGYVAAPVLGRPDVAAKGALNVLVAGPSDAIERVRPVLDAIAAKVWPMGEEAHLANVAKLSANFMIAAAIEAMAEAFTLGAKHGIDPHKLHELFTGTLFASPAYKTYGGFIVDRQFEPAAFQMPLGLKDMRLVLAAAEAARAPMPLASLLRDNFVDALANGGEAKDWSALAEVAFRRAALKA